MHTKKTILWTKLIGAGAAGLTIVSGCNRGQQPQQAPVAAKPSGTPRAAATAIARKPAPRTPAAATSAPKHGPGKPGAATPRSAPPRKPLPIPTKDLGTAAGRIKTEQNLKPIIITAMKENPALKGTAINVIIAGKHVILTGTVKTQTQMDAAGATVAKTVSGAVIRNHIQVNQNPGKPLPDAP